MQSKRMDIESQSQVEDEEQAEFVLKEIDSLQECGINVADINKLKSAGLCTIASILMTTKRDLLNIKGISDQKLDKIIEAATKLSGGSFISGVDVLNKRKQILRISTGSTRLDELLKGGMESQAITEIYGEYRTGKTQICHTLAVTAQLPRKMGGGEGKVMYIDSENSFRPERIAPIAERYGLDKDAVLANISYARAYTTEHQASLLVTAAAMMMQDHYSLLIIDSIMALYRVDFSGRGQLSERQQDLGKFLSKLMKLAEQFNVAVVITNQGRRLLTLVMADPGGGMGSFMGDTKKPIGGHVLAHASTTRLYFKKGKGDERICKVIDSPYIAEAEAVFKLSNEGVADASD